MSKISSSGMERLPRNSCYYNPPTPSSFSSTLLDTIYRSFDESHHLSSQSTNQRKKQESGPDIFRELTTLKNQQNKYDSNDQAAAATMKKSSSVYQVRGSMMDIHNLSSSMEEGKGGVLLSRGQQRNRRSNGRRFSLGSVESISSSSDDVDGPFYRGSLGQATTPVEEDNNNKEKKKNKKNNSKLSLKPIRTSVLVLETDQKMIHPSPRERMVDETPRGTKNNRFPEQQQQQRLKSEGKSSTAKSRAMKFYGDLKRMKQPISPGGRLATFLNSLFSAASNGVVGGSGGAKKQRISTSSDGGGRWDRESSNIKSPAFTAAATPSTNCCSTASSSSLSRSCLSSKSTSTSSTTGKRSVRFGPVRFIIDEDMRPCGQKSFSSEEELMRLGVMEKNRRVEEAARDLLKNYQAGGSEGGNHNSDRTMRDIMDVVKREEEEEEDDDDGASCCSSDLFELENLLEIGRHHRNEVDRYREELPVYETTHVGTNRAIASGLIV